MSWVDIFLVVNILVIGALLTLAAQHAYAHFRPRREIKPTTHGNQNAHIPADVRQHLIEAAEANYQNVLNKAAVDLQRDLETTAAKLNEQLGAVGGTIIQEELKKNQTQMDATAGVVSKKLAAQEAELESSLIKSTEEMQARLAEELANEKQRLAQLLDTKLADAVASFLVETLGKEVDLGAQAAYLTSMLEAHKDELIKGVTDEA
jgi:hypothetical protein